MSQEICVICDAQPTWAWTDTHGVAQCVHCGAPYKLYHYEGEGEQQKRVDKSPECCVLPHWLPLLKRYRADTGKLIPGGYSFPGGQEVSTRDDARAFNEWCDAHRADIDAAKASASTAAEHEQGKK